MTPQQFIELYGKSIYTVRLEAATKLLGQFSAQAAIDLADEFVEALMAENYPQRILDMYPE